MKTFKMILLVALSMLIDTPEAFANEDENALAASEQEATYSNAFLLSGWGVILGFSIYSCCLEEITDMLRRHPVDAERLLIFILVPTALGIEGYVLGYYLDLDENLE